MKKKRSNKKSDSLSLNKQYLAVMKIKPDKYVENMQLLPHNERRHYEPYITTVVTYGAYEAPI